MTAADVDAAVELAGELLARAAQRRTRRERSQASRMARLLSDPAGFEVVLALTDEVLRIRQPSRAAKVLAGLVTGTGALGPLDRAALATGARLAPIAPGIVVPAARQRVRAEMGAVILPAGRRRLARHAERRRRQGIRLNVNVLGEAMLGDGEALRRHARIKEVLAHPAVDYVSVKVSSVCAQLDVLRFDHEVDRVAARLRDLYGAAGAKFVNLDMEEYRDLELTLAVFKKVLDEPPFESVGAGVVLQAYLPDSLAALEDLCAWARARRDRAGGWIKVRIVKGANLAMERIDAEIHGWPQAPFGKKDQTDANYKRMLEVALDPANEGAVRLGVASHNLFETAWAAVRAGRLGASGRVEFEMLEGMSPAVAEYTAERFGSVLLYAPIVERAEIESAIAYLVRRLDENTSPDNYLAHQFSLVPGSPEWEAEAGKFRRAVAESAYRVAGSNRVQDRAAEKGRTAAADRFDNEPDTDFTIPANRRWAAGHLDAIASTGLPDYAPVVAGRRVESGEPQPGVDPSGPGRPAYRWFAAGDAEVEDAIASARQAGAEWASTPAGHRRAALLGAADALARERGRLLAVMAHDTAKTVREGDPEVSEAIDFATYYADHIPEVGTGFRPHGTVVVASPWNFPLSIPAGGVLAALAAGNAVILKPAPEAVAVAAELCRVLWEGGIAEDALQFVPCTDGDASRRLITDPRVDAVVLTGAWDTARMFLGWRPDLRLHAETSGKNAIVVTATADLDEAVADLVQSAFGHAGQKCSAASLAIIEAAVHDDPRFLRRLADAVASITVGPAWDLTTRMGPLIRPPEGPLLRALTSLGPGERWLVRPERLDDSGYLWSPGLKVGVRPGSEFHLTECFGPVLGIMRAHDLDQAVEWQNTPAYGLTAGLQALDPAEIETWRERVHAGNLYVNRGITGAIVRRQPFGGWKRSVVGPGAKAGGPNYVASLGSFEPATGVIVDGEAFAAACRQTWKQMRDPVDETGLTAESNALRYVPLRSVLVCAGEGTTDAEVRLAVTAGAAASVVVTVAAGDGIEAAIRRGGVDKVRLLGTVDGRLRLAAADAGLWVDDTAVAADPAREMLRWAREQAVSESRHRHGNVTSRRPGLVPLAG